MKPGFIVVFSDETPREALKQHDTGTYKTLGAAKGYITKSKLLMSELGITAAIMFYDGKKITTAAN